METQCLSDICEYRKGKVAVGGLSLRNYISTENLVPNKGGIIEASGLPDITSTQEYKSGDVLVSNIRPYFKKIWHAKTNGGCSNDVLVFTAKPGIDPLFLYYVLADDKFFDFSMASAKGTKMPRGDKSAIMNFCVPKFDLNVQRKIGQFLRNIDDKISINTQINGNLLEQANTIFKSWFVDFECFNEPMKKSPVGSEIPESLEMIQIEKLPHILETGRRPKGGAVQEGIPSVGAESVKGIGNYSVGSAKYIPVEFAAKLKTGKVNGYELMIYKDGGKPGEFHPHFSIFGEGYPYKDFFINEHVFKLDFGDVGFNEFAYFYFQTDYVMNWLEINGGKAAIPGINQSVVNSIWIFHPAHPIVKEFCNFIKPIITQVLKNCYQNMRLSELRDSILPHLMSGELDVSELEI